MTDRLLPSWRPGPTRDAIIEFLDAAGSVPVIERVACFDNDGTLWCEKPEYPQLLFCLHALKARAATDASVGDTPEFAALMGGDRRAIGELGLERIGFALMSLFEGVSPEAFNAQVREFMLNAPHPTLGRPLITAVFQPMLELIEELRRRQFLVAVVTGGGTEFVRTISQELYGVSPEAVVGTLIEYSIGRDEDGRPSLARTVKIDGKPNEGPAKVGNIEAQLGRRPIIAGGNSGGDRDMLEWATGGDGPRLALLLDHDDADREFDYVGKAESFTETESITDVAGRLGWTVISMANDWATIFPDVIPRL